MVFCHEREEQCKTHSRSTYPSTVSLCVEFLANVLGALRQFQGGNFLFPYSLSCPSQFTAWARIYCRNTSARSVQFIIHSHTCLLLQTVIEKTCEMN